VAINGDLWELMPLTGTYARTLDQKHRIAIPKRLRDDLGGDGIKAVFVAPGTQHSLAMYTEDAFEAVAQRMQASSDQRANARNYARMFYSQAERLEIDGQGRIRLPDRLVEHAKLSHATVLLGVQDHVEIWDEATWTEFLKQHSAEFDELAEEAFQ